MTKKRKILLLVVFALIVSTVAIVSGVLNKKDTVSGEKTFNVQIVSERDSYDETYECTSEAEFLGEFLRDYDLCIWEDSTYGIYIKGFDSMHEDIDNQYWWCVYVNDTSSTTGADDIPLKDGDTYTFVLKKGW